MLIPCGACRRHIETTETACPFCEAPNQARPIARSILEGRFSRAAVFAGATAIAAPGCIVNSPPPQYQYQQQPPPPPNDPYGDPNAGDPNAGDPNTANAGDPSGGDPYADPNAGGSDYAQPPPGDPNPPDYTTQPPPDDTRQPPPIPAAVLRGRIVDQRGRPAPSVQIELRGGPQPIYGITEADGTYRIALDPGSYRMAIVGAGAPRTVKLVAGKESVVNLSIVTKSVVPDRSNIPKPYGAPPARRRTV